MDTEFAQDEVGQHHRDGDDTVVAPDAGLDPTEASIDTVDKASIDAVDSLLDEVERALSRLDDGTYGLCTTCGQPIDDARLAAAPTAQSCLTCVSPATV
jgi:DnaK suppressor protein